MLARQFAGGRLVAPFDIEVSTGRRAYVIWSDDTRDNVSTAAFIDWMIEEIAARDGLERAAVCENAAPRRSVPVRPNGGSAPAFDCAARASPSRIAAVANKEFR